MKKFVITGGPCTGKTTTINLLAERGFPVINELATQIKKEELKNSLKSGIKEFHLKILERQVKVEKDFKGKVVFIDRSIVDALAYLLHNGLNLRNHFIPYIEKANYTKVFFLNSLDSYENNEIRKETPEEAEAVHNKILETYKDLGFSPIIVHKMPAEERVDFIIEKINS